jgi:hypothetical protein
VATHITKPHITTTTANASHEPPGARKSSTTEFQNHQDTMGAGGENELDIVAWINGQLMELRYAETPRR